MKWINTNDKSKARICISICQKEIAMTLEQTTLKIMQRKKYWTKMDLHAEVMTKRRVQGYGYQALDTFLRETRKFPAVQTVCVNGKYYRVNTDRWGFVDLAA